MSLALRRTGAVELQPVRAVSQGDLGPTGPGRPVGPRSPWLTARTGCSSTAPVRRSARDIDPA